MWHVHLDCYMNKDIIKQGLDEIALIDKDVGTALAIYSYPEPRIRPTGIETFFFHRRRSTDFNACSCSNYGSGTAVIT